jgi:hypothetical protein
MAHQPLADLQAGLAWILESPRERGTLEMVVRRPAVDAREVLDRGELDLVHGLVGDSWRERRSSRTPDGSPHPDMQLNLMNVRVVSLLAGDRSRWPLAGDQLLVDFDLSEDNVPAGTRLAVGAAVIEITSQPHTGCGKFAARFGVDALKFVNSREGRRLHLRGVNARVMMPGPVRPGDPVEKIATPRQDPGAA